MAARSSDADAPTRAAVSIIVPALNEAPGIGDLLASLQPLRTDRCELLVVDGGSRDATASLAAQFCDRVIIAPRGRAAQMNAGAIEARGDLLIFLHADTRLPSDALTLVRDALRPPGRCWGRFDVRLDSPHPLLGLVATMMNLRSRLTGIATGDQALFVRAETFHALGGFASQPLMEDIDLSRRLRARARPVCLRARVHTSARRWLRHGVLRTIWLMWRLRLAYALGVSPERLARAWNRS